eukprot:Colp12_sorted_trinity150504_noHs@653
MSIMNKIIVVLCAVACTVSAEWIVGFSGDSCDTTCGKVSKTCTLASLQAVTTSDAFDAVVASSRQLGKTDLPGSTAAFCNGGVNTWPFATAPGVMQYPLYTKSASNPDQGEYVLTNSCYYPATGVQGDCSTVYTVPPSQRFCPCD